MSVSRAKVAEPIKMLWKASWGLKEPCVNLGGVKIPQGKGEIFSGRGSAWACPDLPTVDILSLIRSRAVRPLAMSTVAAC